MSDWPEATGALSRAWDPERRGVFAEETSMMTGAAAGSRPTAAPSPIWNVHVRFWEVLY